MLVQTVVHILLSQNVEKQNYSIIVYKQENSSTKQNFKKMYLPHRLASNRGYVQKNRHYCTVIYSEAQPSYNPIIAFRTPWWV